RIQFRNADTGELNGPVVSVALADLEPKKLALLLNSVLGHTEADQRRSFRFYDPLKAGDVEEFSQKKFLEANGYGAAGTTTTESQVQLDWRAEAVFKVQAVTRCSASVSGHGASILTAAFSPLSSNRLATGGGDNTARIWDCDTGTPRHTLKGHTAWVLCLAWSPDNGMLATGSMDNTLRLWDPEKGTPLGNPLKGHTKWITSLAWEPYHARLPGRPRVASASKDYT
ncbi:ribosome assembly, partial [Teratosphaeriaceae sp. CCFEE 6253]